MWMRGQTTIRPAGSPENPFLNYVGALRAFSDTDQINNELREVLGNLPS